LAEAAKLPELLRLIFTSLRDFDPAVTVDEAREVHRLIARTRNPGNIRYYQSIAKAGGFGAYLREVRVVSAAASEEQAIARTKSLKDLEQGEPCEHGVPSGNAPHPTSGKPLCPLCRHGVRPSTNPNDAPTPEHHQVAIEWGKTRQAAGMDGPPMPVYTRVIAQAKRLLASGLGMRDLLTLARDAAAQDVDLDTQIRIYSGSTNG
jgi:hypothetical protein